MTDLNLGGRESPHYWLGGLAQTIRYGIEELERRGGDDPRRSMRRALDEYESSTLHRPREIVGLAVVDALGECYAIRTDDLEALRAKGEAELHLFEAESCGHPRAASWVRERLPFRILCVDADERADLLDAGTPVLEREP
jgi:hypothetical protein